MKKEQQQQQHEIISILSTTNSVCTNWGIENHLNRIEASLNGVPPAKRVTQILQRLVLSTLSPSQHIQTTHRNRHPDERRAHIIRFSL